MKQVTYRGKSYTYETPKEYEMRMKGIALMFLELCKSERLTINDFYKVLELSEKMMRQKTKVCDQCD